MVRGQGGVIAASIIARTEPRCYPPPPCPSPTPTSTCSRGGSCKPEVLDVMTRGRDDVRRAAEDHEEPAAPAAAAGRGRHRPRRARQLPEPGPHGLHPPRERVRRPVLRGGARPAGPDGRRAPALRRGRRRRGAAGRRRWACGRSRCTRPTWRSSPTPTCTGWTRCATSTRRRSGCALPVMIHTGTSIFPGARSRTGEPMAVDDVAVDFPDLTIVIAHGGRPLWMEQAFFLVRRFPNVYMDVSSIPPEGDPALLPAAGRDRGQGPLRQRLAGPGRAQHGRQPARLPGPRPRRRRPGADPRDGNARRVFGRDRG